MVYITLAEQKCWYRFTTDADSLRALRFCKAYGRLTDYWDELLYCATQDLPWKFWTPEYKRAIIKYREGKEDEWLAYVESVRNAP